MVKILQLQALLDKTRAFDFLGPLALRLYLAPIFWMAGTSKFSAFEDTAAWFGNPDWGLGLPFPTLMAFLATSTELLGSHEEKIFRYERIARVEHIEKILDSL